MDVLLTKLFKKWAKKVDLSEEALLNAIDDLEAGSSVASLGKSLFKIRVKRPHSGKSSGFRTIVVYRKADRCVYLHGFAKSKKDNISLKDLRDLQKFGSYLVNLHGKDLMDLVEEKVLVYIRKEEK